MSSLTDGYLAVLKHMQAEGLIILPGELVRRVKAGPGPDSLGRAQHAAALQSAEQHGIESDTLTTVGRLESAWSGQSGDAARGSLRPLADVAASASVALHDSQSTLADQSHAFTSARDSLQDVSDDPPSRSAWDVLTPWDTDNEKKINARNAAVEQNNAVYQGFTGTSDGHARKMPIDYGQVPDSADGTYHLAPAEDPGQSGTPEQHRPQVTTPPVHRPDAYRPTDQPGPAAAAPPGLSTMPLRHSAIPGDSQPLTYAPPVSHGDDSTGTSGYVPPGSPGMDHTPVQFGPSGSSSGYAPRGSSSYPNPGQLTGMPGSFGPIGGTGTPSAGVSRPGASARGGGPGGPGEAGKSTGTNRFGEPERGVRGGPSAGAPGAKGTNGMPMAGGAGKGGKGEADEEKKAASYLQEADPNSLFGYDGRATPPVIGE